MCGCVVTVWLDKTYAVLMRMLETKLEMVRVQNGKVLNTRINTCN